MGISLAVTAFSKLFVLPFSFYYDFATAQEVDQIQNRMAGIGDKFDPTTTMAGNHIIDSKSKPEFSKTKRLFVGDSVEVRRWPASYVFQYLQLLYHLT